MHTKLALYYRYLATQGPRNTGDRLLLAVLIPFGWLYGCINFIRVKLYTWGIFPRYKSTVPVISVGNLAVGGTGKTPLVDYLIKQQRLNKRTVAVISRGYGGNKCDSVRVVCAGQGPLLPAIDCGDEPYLLARRNPETIIIVSPKRREGIDYAVKKFAVDLIILDDGFQHLAVERDLNLLLFDSRYPVGNGHLLPAGLLREFASAKQRADLCVLTRYEEETAVAFTCKQPLFRAQQRLAHNAQDLAGEMHSLKQLRNGKCVAFAGIACPVDFFTLLGELGITLQSTIPLADHCEFTPQRVDAINTLSADADYLLTTEKDAVKLNENLFDIPCCSFSLVFEPLESDLLNQKIESLFH